MVLNNVDARPSPFTETDFKLGVFFLSFLSFLLLLLLSTTQVLTFDEGGVSGHSDHTAVNRGVALMLRTRATTSSRAGNSGSTDSGRSALDAFELVTTGMVRKYSGVLDMPWSLATSYGPPLGAFFSSFSARIAWAAMAAHHSQFVWYRRLFVIFSRYAYINTFKRMHVAPPPPPLPYQ